jgi:hypothetical protein
MKIRYENENLSPKKEFSPFCGGLKPENILI